MVSMLTFLIIPIVGHIRMGCFLGMELVIKLTVFGHLTLAMRYS
jgi:uncharacterized protein (DUF983 family)